MTTDEIEMQIADAFSRSQYKWRTVRSVAREIGLSADIITSTVRSSDKFVRAKKPNARGELLYTTSKRYRSETSFLERLLGAAANSVSE